MTLLLLCKGLQAQQLSLGNTPSFVTKSAVLELNSSRQGLLFPRLSDTVGINALNPPDGMVIYFVPSKQLLIRTRGYWNPVMVSADIASTTSNSWLTTGNTNVSAGSFLGTLDDKALILKSANSNYVELGRRQTLGLVQAYTDYSDANEQVLHMKAAVQFHAPAASFYKPKIFVDAAGNFRTKGSSAGTDYFEFGATGTNNNGGFEFIIGDDGDEPIVFKSYHYQNGMTEMMRLQSGRMAVGSNSFNATNPEKLLIDAGNTTSYNLMTGKGSIDNYLQINVQNRSATANASSDIVATADNGDENGGYIDMGINSSAFANNTYPMIGGANNAYLYATGNDFVIGNATAGRPLRFFTGGYALANERLRIDGNGRVGIGNTSPLEAVDITGNLRFSGALMPGGSAGTSGFLLQSNGAGAAPSWINSQSLLNSVVWMLDGNNLSTPKRFGTTSNHALPFITNNLERMRIDERGNVAIGTTTFDAVSPEKLLVDAGSSTYTPILAQGNYNGYFQINVKNHSTGNQSSSDLVATANNGTETTNFVNVGINGSNYVYQNGNPIITGKANDGYLLSAGNDFYIVNNNATKDIIFLAGGTAPANEAMRITAAEKLGIGTTTPSERLHLVLPTGSGTVQTPVATMETTNTTTTATSMPPVFSLLRQIPSFAASSSYSGPVLSFGFRTNGTANNLVQLTTTSGPTASRISFHSRTGMTNANPATGTLAENMFLEGTSLNVKNLAGGATSLSVDANGYIIRTASDARLKMNIRQLENALDKITKLRGVSYNWIDTIKMGSKKEIGFIAQELEKVVPEVVSNGGEYKSVNYPLLTALIVEGMKEQQTEINDLKKEMQELREEMKLLRKEKASPIAVKE
ncbi:MAG TPA: tail fiber domain-containing protein [Flavisolibacter sp.]|nr:tail fiber domain-containing protein [Flavisolibacter sp.]